jgi:anti-sigma B factor antagonist
MKFSIKHEDGVAEITLKADKLDSKIAPDLKSQFIHLANDADNKALIIDLQGVSFADSSGLSALLLAYRLYRDANRKLVLFNIPERVQKLIEISQLTSAFTMTATRQDAIDALNS